MSSIASEDRDVPNAKPRTSGSPLSVVSDLVGQCDELIPRVQESAEDCDRINQLNDANRELDRTLREELRNGCRDDIKLRTLESREKRLNKLTTSHLETRREGLALINRAAECLRILPLVPQVSLIRAELEKAVKPYAGQSASFVSLGQSYADLKVIRVRLSELQTALLGSGEIDHAARRTAKSVRIPQDLGAELEAVIGKRGHTREEACQLMGSTTGTPLDPKTLRKVREGKGRIHSSTLKRVRAYIDASRATPTHRER